jgi:hypothetical protein
VGRPFLAAPVSYSKSANSLRIKQEVACNGKIKYGWIATSQML